MVLGRFFMVPGRFSWFFMVRGRFFMVPGCFKMVFHGSGLVLDGFSWFQVGFSCFSPNCTRPKCILA